MNILTLIPLIIFVYMLYHTYKCENEIECLSDIAYDKHQVLFPLSLLIIILFLTPSILLVTSSNLHWLCIVTVLSLFGVGVLPYKDSKFKYILHFIFAIISILGVLCLWIFKGFWFIPVLFCVTSLRKKWLLGLEIGLLSSMFLYPIM